MLGGAHLATIDQMRAMHNTVGWMDVCKKILLFFFFLCYPELNGEFVG
jgi:hypothetical protein